MRWAGAQVTWQEVRITRESRSTLALHSASLGACLKNAQNAFLVGYRVKGQQSSQVIRNETWKSALKQHKPYPLRWVSMVEAMEGHGN